MKRFTPNERRLAYRNLPDEIQELIMSSETTDFISKALKTCLEPQDDYDEADSQILYAMLGLQNLADAIRAIAEMTKKPLESFSRLSLDLQKEIFSKIPQQYLAAQTEQSKIVEITEPIESTKSTAIEIPPQNLPMVEVGETVHDTIPEVKSAPVVTQAPIIPPKSIIEEKMAAPVTVSAPKSYTEGQDPYREPIQ